MIKLKGLLSKIEGIKISEKDLAKYQSIEGRSFIFHRCCGEGMYRIKNPTLKNDCEFYICGKCGGVDIPLIPKALRYAPEKFYKGAKVHKK